MIEAKTARGIIRPRDQSNKRAKLWVLASLSHPPGDGVA